MKFISKYLLIVFLLNSFSLFSQNEGNVWYFGKNAGADFNTPFVQALTDGQFNGHGGSATISDLNGNLLFYTNGVSVWNANHTVMPNGFGLLGHPSATQSSVIVPKPGSSNIYYVFTNDVYTSNNGLHYSEVDMSLNGGLGDVTANKNILLVSSTAEKLTATRHSNQTGFWVITHGRGDNSFYSFPITNTGVGTAVISNIGISHINGDPNSDESVGQMKASPDGTKLAVATSAGGNTIEIFDFSNISGIVSNPLTISSSIYANPYGVEFSADGTKLYASTTNNNKVFQFNLQAGSSSAIIASSTLVVESASTNIGALQLAPDSRIYFARYLNEYLGVIDNPNAIPSNLVYVDDGLYLGGQLSRRGLPNFIQSYFNNPRFTYDNLCLGDSTYFYISDLTNVLSVLWNFDDPVSGANNTSTLTNPYHIFSTAGDFHVKLIRYFTGYSDTVTQLVTIHPLPSVNLGSSLIKVCDGSDTVLFAGVGFESYLWQNGSSTPTLTVSAPGIYSVTVTDDFGCQNSDDVTIATLFSPFIDLGNDTIICEESNLLISAYFEDANYMWGPGIGNVSSSIFISDPGTYYVTVSNKCGQFLDTITLDIYPTISFSLGEDIQMCTGDSITLDPGDLGVSYLWSDGSTNQSIEVFTSGIYFLDAFHDNTNCIVASDTVQVNVLDLPVLTVNGDSIGCFGDQAKLLAEGDFITTYQWSSGESTSQISVSSSGTYYVTASNICASVSDSLSVQIFSLPTAQIIPDTAIFTGDSIQLWVDGNLLWDYLWSPDYAINSISITEPVVFPESTTTYSVLVTDTNSCVNNYYVTISVSDKPLPEIIWYNSFSPNGDGVNDFWVIDNIEDYENSMLEIFNRDGNKVFSAKNYQNDWDGKYHDKDVPAHTYFFILDPGVEGVEIIKGHVTIIR